MALIKFSVKINLVLFPDLRCLLYKSVVQWSAGNCAANVITLITGHKSDAFLAVNGFGKYLNNLSFQIMEILDRYLFIYLDI